jgi:hypothetical protein
MPVRRSPLHIFLGLLLVATLFFGLGNYSARFDLSRDMARRDARIDRLSAEVSRAVAELREQQVEKPSAMIGTSSDRAAASEQPAPDPVIDRIKRELQTEMGLLPVQLLRDCRQSFVELYSYDNEGHSNYGTAGYLGSGYFVTVKHAVVTLPASDSERITAVKVCYHDRMIPATIVDVGDADVEVAPGDWAIIRVAEHVDLPPLKVNVRFPYEFADPIFRLGNDYSKGIILSTGYVGQRTPNGLVTCLTDGHPGVSGGGVLDQNGEMVGIPIGRMQGDYRFSFILPLRREMFRKVPLPKQPAVARAAKVASAQ